MEVQLLIRRIKIWLKYAPAILENLGELWEIIKKITSEDTKDKIETMIELNVMNEQRRKQEENK